MLGLIALSFAIAFYSYPKLPDEITSHWNVAGEPDGTTSKFWGLFMLPFIMTATAGVFALIPRIDPLKENITQFKKYYDGLVLLILVFLIFVQLQIILWSLGKQVGPNQLLPVGLGLLFYYIGIVCIHSKRNWFIGVRTPWTLSSEAVWEKTNKLGGNLFKITGIIVFLGVWFPSIAIYFIVVPTLVSGITVIVYSYLEFKKETSSRSNQT